MARWDAAAIPQLAALFFAGVHVLLAAEIAGVVAMSYAPGERPPWLFAIGATMAAIVALFPFAVSRELLRRRE